MEYFSTAKRSRLLTHAARWRGPKIITSGRNQTKKVHTARFGFYDIPENADEFMITESRSAVTQGQKQPGRWVGSRDPKGPKETSEGDRHVPVLIVLMCVDMCVWVCGCVCRRQTLSFKR